MSEKFNIYSKIFFRDGGTLFDTCVNWSCVTRCGCRTTSSTLFTVWPLAKNLVMVDYIPQAGTKDLAAECTELLFVAQYVFRTPSTRLPDDAVHGPNR
jgi:hypothetical protein